MKTSSKNKKAIPPDMDGEIPLLPGTKLPPVALSEEAYSGMIPSGIKKAWIDYMVLGFKNNEEMFRKTLNAFMKPYRLTIWMYGFLFTVGIIFFVVAVIIGLRDSKSVVAIAFAGLGAATFLAFFIRQPVQALEENLEFITWLGVAFNTYWTRLMFMMDTKTIQTDLKAADNDFCTSIERMIIKHSDLRSKRPGGDLDSKKRGKKKSENIE